jgi:hypothetical protein
MCDPQQQRLSVAVPITPVHGFREYRDALWSPRNNRPLSQERRGARAPVYQMHYHHDEPNIMLTAAADLRAFRGIR